MKLFIMKLNLRFNTNKRKETYGTEDYQGVVRQTPHQVQGSGRKGRSFLQYSVLLVKETFLDYRTQSHPLGADLRVQRHGHYFFALKLNEKCKKIMNDRVTMTVSETAKLLGVSPQCVRVGLESGAFKFGTVVRMKRNVYVIYRSAVEQLIGRKEGSCSTKS